MNIGYLMGVAFEMDSRCAVSGDLDEMAPLIWLSSRTTCRRGRRMCMSVETSGVTRIIGLVFTCGLANRTRRHWVVRVHVELTDGSTLLQHNVSGHSVWAQHPDSVHFGLGDRSKVSRLVVRWPDGETTELSDPAPDQYHVVTR